MGSYIAKIIFRINVEESANTSQFDEQLRLIYADDDAEALFKAQVIGREEENTFLNTAKRRVTWEFIDVAEIKYSGELHDGMELHSRIHEEEDPDAYIGFVKAMSGQRFVMGEAEARQTQSQH